jgi:uncharacterized protein (TIGR02145 family)
MKTKSFIYLALSLLLAAFVIAYSSCKKEEDEKPTTNETVISDETLIAEDKGLENPTVSGNTYTYDYSGSAPDVSVGNVIVGQTGEGYMRIVTGVSYKNNQIILETEQAKLTDVIDNCDISDSITLNLGQKSATINGSPINVEVTGLKEGMTIEEDLINLSNVVLFSGEVNGVALEAKITEGYISFEPVIRRKLKIRRVNGKPTITEFLLTAKGQMDFVCDVEASCDGNLSYTPEMDPLLTFWIGPMFFGPIPAFIKFSFTPGFESAFIINGYLTKGYQANATIEFGAQYFYGEGWQKITDKNFTFNEDPLQWSLNGNLHAKTWVTPQIDLKLAGVLGPYMNVNPFLGFDGQVHLPQWSWALTGGVDGYLGFDMSLFGWHIVNLNTPIFDWEVVIAEQSGVQAGLPVVATKAVSEITASSATCGGNISSDGGAAVTARGVCWSTSQNPTIAGSHTNDASGTGQFTSTITGLNANTTYFVRAYATNSEGMAYGAQVQFATISGANIPTISTKEISNITQNTASGGGNVSDEGSSSVVARGVCWSTSQNPTIAGSHTNDGSGTGQFTSSITGLNANTTYFVRAYATNSEGMAYGAQVQFATISGANIPTISTKEISNITQNTASGGGNVSDEGSSSVSARGVCWSTSQNPTIAGSHTNDGSGTGQFTSTITGLNANTTYFVRAYATNSTGTAYGNQLQFATQGSGGSGEPCPGMETITYGGQVYNTVLIGSQCWMKENLNIGTMIPGDDEMQDNGIFEKYCYDDDPANCDEYGGLYQWNELMQYVTNEGAQGLCPEGWHLPTDAEWTGLTDYVSSQPEYLCNSITSYIAKALAATTNWNSSSNTCAVGNNPSANNATGFSGLPGGYRLYDGTYHHIEDDGYWWSSTEYSTTGAWSRTMNYGNAYVGRNGNVKGYGFSVRCLRD